MIVRTGIQVHRETEPDVSLLPCPADFESLVAMTKQCYMVKDESLRLTCGVHKVVLVKKQCSDEYADIVASMCPISLQVVRDDGSIGMPKKIDERAPQLDPKRLP